MSGMLRQALVVSILAPAVIAGTSAVQAQSTQTVAVIGVAAQPLVAAGSNRPRVFVSNLGSASEQPAGKGLSITGGPGQAYNKFYAAVQSSGQYQLVISPAEADFVFEFRYTAPIEHGSEWVKRDPFNKKKFPPEKELVEYDLPHPRISLVIFDPRTQGVYGGWTEPIKLGHNQDQRDALFSSAIKSLVSQAGSLLDRAPVGGDVPRYAGDPPLPSQIKSAKTAFIANADTSPSAYNSFYSMMESWGGYQLLPSTAGADLIFQVSGNPLVVVRDPQTGAILWGFTSTGHVTILKRNEEKDTAQALTNIVREIATMGGRPAPSISIPPDGKDAPIPQQLINAKTVFISNTGIEPLLDLTDKPLEIYSTLYATLQSWGRFKPVLTPAEADLVFTVSTGNPFVKLTIVDPATQATLWQFDQKIRGRIHGTIGEQEDVDKVIAALMTSIARLAGDPEAHITVTHNAQELPPLVNHSQKAFISKPRYPDNYYERQAPGELYREIKAGVESWGRYELTPAKDADVILEPSVWNDDVQLTIRDARTRNVLWTFVRPVGAAFFNHTAVKNYQTAIGLVVDDLRRAASPSQDTMKTAESR
jgi:hypothetical protein